MSSTELEHARAALSAARCVIALTGAGISAESGVPTFRGAGGMWKDYRPQDLATPEAFAHDPRLVWQWYAWRRDLVAECEPNAAHLALAGAARDGWLAVVTQNVDGLHGVARARAGAGHGEVVELHGSLFGVRCTRCAARYEARERLVVEAGGALPACRECSGMLRPDVVWFGEQLERTHLERAFTLAAAADVCLVIGTSAVVQPAASVATATLDAGGTIIEVNPDATPLTAHATIALAAAAADTVPRLLDGVGDHVSPRPATSRSDLPHRRPI